MILLSSGENTRQLSYSQTDLFLCFFSIAHRRSFSDIAEYWVPEIRSNVLDAHIILVGTKIDLRADEKLMREIRENGNLCRPVPTEEGEKLCKDLNLDCYLEISAKTNDGIDELVNRICKICTKKEESREKRECTMS
eukprot:TRINITY_DN3610_c0_g1_i2.p1 TRINITY_DN3610_c0_g1~~TRINITY_DN3610_c0_g1_i2.p1  ORF type:complete len:137 (-),score=32.97 TRINITY_DN3610_c0_g1_i2:59-469(-)